MTATPSRRSFVGGLLAAGALAQTRGLAQRVLPQARARWVLLGTHDGQGISRAAWHPETGTLGQPELAAPTPQPSYLVRHPHLPVLYACNEKDNAAGDISAFTIGRAGATLTPLATVPAGGSAPCFASVARTGRLLFAANYGSGSLSAYHLDRHGKPSAAPQTFTCSPEACGAPGPMHERQAGPHLHCAVLSPDNRFLLACDLGDDSILVFPIHPSGPKILDTPRRFATEAGAGPRHLVFHPNGRWLFCINELGCTVTVFGWRSGARGGIERALGASVKVLPPGAQPGTQAGTAAGSAITNTGAEIRISHDGRFLYTSTRGADILTVFAVDAPTGALTQVQQLPCGGKIPRFFALDPTERWLLCAHQGSDSISTFARNLQTGKLTPQGTYPAPNPECIVWL